MSRKILEETKAEIQKLYDEGLKLLEIVQQTSVSYSSVYGMTRVRQRINPETGKKYESLSELHDYQARQRAGKNKNKDLSYLIIINLEKLNKTQSWLAQQIGVSGQSVSSYSQGKLIPEYKTLEKLFTALEVKKKPKSLDYLIEE